MKFREPLLELLRQPGYRPATVLELSRLLGLNKKLRPQLAHEVRTLLAKGDLDLVKGDRIAAANFNRGQNYSPQFQTGSSQPDDSLRPNKSAGSSANAAPTSATSGPRENTPPRSASAKAAKADKADKYAPPGRPIFAPGGKATKGLPMANEKNHDTIPAFVPPNSKAGKAARAAGKTVKAAKASKAAATEWKNQTAAEAGAAYAKEKAAADKKSGKAPAPKFSFAKSEPADRRASDRSSSSSNRDSDRSSDRESSAPRYAQDAVTGKINFRASGFAFVVPPRLTDGPAVESIQIFPEDTGVALHGDTVEVAVNPGRRNRRDGKGTELTGRVLQVIERGHDTVVGNLQKIRNQFYVKPDDPRLFHEVTVTDPSLTKLKPVPAVGDKVVVRLAEWKQRKQLIHGVIIERLGKTFEPRAELAGIYHKFKLDPTFPAAVESEVADLPDTVQPQELAGRLDYRTIPTFTIDPDDAKDFDDALSIEYLDGGDIRIGIHIADVSAYVKPGTALDKEAQRRGNSTYLVGTVIPMLPEKLSNGLCSLVEAQDRLTKAVFLVFDAKGRPKSHTFANTVIRSRKRLTYKQAYALLFEKSLDKIRALPLPAKHQTGSTGRALNSLTDEELTELQTWIRQLWKIASKLRQDRMANGSLDLDMPETKVFVDAEGYADRLEKIEHDESHQLIEEFMLAANESVARLTKSNKLASIYRVHDEPDSEKLNELREYLVTQDIRTGDLTNRDELVNLLHTLTTHPQGYTLRTQLLRSLKKAAYRGSPDGHFGLAKKDYTHFTSPIRRYSDLAVHRVFDHYLIKKGDLPTPNGYKYAYSAAKMDALGEHLSLTEINSAEAERESVKIKLLEFFERELAKEKKTTFAAVITDVRPNGLFVELTESMTFGFISMNTLTDDVYTINNAGDALTGRRTKKVYQLAAKLEVCVEKVDRFKRLIDFRPSDIPSSAKPPAQTSPARR